MFQHSGNKIGGAVQRAEAAGAAAGKRTLTEDLSAESVHAAASHGTSGAGGALPHLDLVQRAFGRHDVGGIQAHVGGQAAEGAAAMGARAYAVGDRVAFSGAPDLHTAAHEAAHVVQQRGGVQLKGGVGTAGDTYEQHADAVADAVVAGQSAEALLDQHAAPGASAQAAPAVQRITDGELKARGARVAELAKTAPTSGMNLWMAEHKKLGAAVYLLGTEHGLHLQEMVAWPSLVEFLRGIPFTRVLSETTARFDRERVDVPPDVAGLLQSKLELERDFNQKFPKNAPEPTGKARIEKFRGEQQLSQASSGLGKIDGDGLDDAYVALAMTDSEGRPKRERTTLETTETRKQAALQNAKDLDVDLDNKQGKFASTIYKVSPRPEENTGPGAIKAGNQQSIFAEQAKEMLEGRDVANAEERNSQWMERLYKEKNLVPGDMQLWIVGAAHLPGLILRFQDLDWVVKHLPPLPPPPPEPQVQAPSQQQQQPPQQQPPPTSGGSGGTVEEVD